MDLKENSDLKNRKITFNDYYKSLEEVKRSKLRNEILTTCEISYSSFYYKQSKAGSFTRLEKEEINRICGINFIW
jgi:hypothetical protein